MLVSAGRVDGYTATSVYIVSFTPNLNSRTEILSLMPTCWPHKDRINAAVALVHIIQPGLNRELVLDRIVEVAVVCVLATYARTWR